MLPCTALSIGEMSRNVRKRNFWHVRPTKTQSVCASTQSNQSLRCLYEENLHPWLSKILPEKNLIRRRECTGDPEISVGARVRRYFFDVEAKMLL